MSKTLGPSGGQPIRTFLVGKALTSLQQMFATSSDIEISGTARNGKEALARIPKSHTQVICTELDLPIMDGLDLTRGIMATDPRAILVVSRLGQQEDRDKTFQLIEAGAIDVFAMSGQERGLVFDAWMQELIKKSKYFLASWYCEDDRSFQCCYGI